MAARAGSAAVTGFPPSAMRRNTSTWCGCSFGHRLMSQVYRISGHPHTGNPSRTARQRRCGRCRRSAGGRAGRWDSNAVCDNGPCVKPQANDHPHAERTTPSPGIGVVTGARVLTEFGDDPDRHRGAKNARITLRPANLQQAPTPPRAPCRGIPTPAPLTEHRTRPNRPLRHPTTRSTLRHPSRIPRRCVTCPVGVLDAYNLERPTRAIRVMSIIRQCDF